MTAQGFADLTAEPQPNEKSIELGLTDVSSNTRAAAVSSDSLRPADFESFERLGIPPDVVNGAGVRRVSHDEARELCGIRYRSHHLEGVAFPYYSLQTGDTSIVTWRVRRDHPELDGAGNPVAKYVSPPDPKRLYVLPAARSALADTSIAAIVVEAEKSVLAIEAAIQRTPGRPKLLAIGLGGAWGWRGRTGKTTSAAGARVDEKGPIADLDRIDWTNRDVMLCFDANAATNEQVQAARRALAAELTTRGAQVRIAALPIAAGINGADDFIGQHGADAFFALLDSAPRAQTTTSLASPKESQANLLLQIARDAHADLFRDGDIPYVRFRAGSHSETHRLRRRAVRGWLTGLYMDAFGNKVPGGQAMADALNSLEALALRGEDIQVHVRIAAANGRVYVDLADAEWRVLELSPNNWRIICGVDAPVRFRRAKAMLPLVEPRRGGSLELLRQCVNVTSDDDFVLIVALLIGWFRGRGPYPFGVINGEQGSIKSTTVRMLKRLIDPNQAPLRSAPGNERDLIISATNQHLLAFDNLSTLPPWLSDALSRLATGSGFATRQLYSDDEESIFSAARPAVFNGIPDLVAQLDLVDRSIFVTAPPIPEDRRLEERVFWSNFERDEPLILGALCDAVCMALKNETTVRLERRPRMADFATWVCAAEPACPWAAGTFLAAYRKNRHEAIQLTLEGDPLAEFVKSLARDGGWTGSATQLLALLNSKMPQTVGEATRWRKQPNQLSGALRRIAPGLRALGVHIDSDRQGHGGAKVIIIRRLEQVGDSSTPSSPSTAAAETPGESADDGRRHHRQATVTMPVAVSSADDMVTMVPGTSSANDTNKNGHGVDGGDGGDRKQTSSNETSWIVL